MPLAYSKGMALGTAAPDFSLPATDGKTYRLEDFDAPVLVVVFTCNHCPYAIAVEDRLVRLANAYREKGVQFAAINPNDAQNYPADSFEHMVERAKTKRFPFPYLRDESQAVARAYDAACTPDVFVFGEDRKLAYNGRVDDNWQDESKVEQRDLEEVLNALLEQRPVHLAKVVPSMGCSIKWKPASA